MMELHYFYLLLIIPIYPVVDSHNTKYELSPRHMMTSQGGAASAGDDVDEECCYQYNVLYPQNCREQDCTLGVRWEQHDEWVEFNLMGRTYGSSVWIAMGLSTNGLMADSDVVTCWHHNNQYKLHRAWNTQVGHNSEIQEDKKVSAPLQFLHANYTNGLFMCNFKKIIVPQDDVQHVKQLTQNWHVLLAWGQLELGSDETVMQKHIQHYSTGCLCNVTNCYEICLCIDQFRELLFKLHGSIMCVVFVFLLPTAALVARHYRQVFPEKWFECHVILMVAGVLGMILGLGFILGHTGGTFTPGPHQLMGIITIGAGVIQVIIGIIRPHASKSLLRRLFEIFHRLNAVLVLILGATTLSWGVWLLHHSHYMALIWMGGIWAFSIVTTALFFILLELKTRLSLCHGNDESPVEYHKLEQPSPNETESEEEVYIKENNLFVRNESPFFREKVIFLLFILQSFTVTGLLSAFVFYDIPEET